jgi:hypothetical protein
LLDIKENEVSYNNANIGFYESSTRNERYQNVINLQQNETAFWTSNELPKNYQYESFLNKEVFGANLEWRFIKNDRMGPPQGFYINTGIIMYDTSVKGLGLIEREWLFPLGLGIIIPGDDKLRVEITTNTVVGTSGSFGAKFDFSFVYQDVIKFGPDFIYLQNTRQMKSQASGLGVHIGFILPQKKFNKRR